MQDNGSPTKTVALQAGSLAINAGTGAGMPTTDRRAFTRVGNVDVGAFEVGGVTSLPILTGTFATNGARADNAAVSHLFAGVVVSDANGDTVKIVLGGAANGTLSGGGFAAQAGVYQLIGSPSAATAALGSVVLTPSNNQVANRAAASGGTSGRPRPARAIWYREGAHPASP